MAFMVITMKKVLRDCIPKITMPFLDGVLINGCPKETKIESSGADGCKKFAADHVADCK